MATSAKQAWGLQAVIEFASFSLAYIVVQG
jgi:hypothetical protein